MFLKQIFKITEETEYTFTFFRIFKGNQGRQGNLSTHLFSHLQYVTSPAVLKCNKKLPTSSTNSLLEKEITCKGTELQLGVKPPVLYTGFGRAESVSVVMGETGAHKGGIGKDPGLGEKLPYSN